MPWCVQLTSELSRNLNVTMLLSHRVDKEKTQAIDNMQQYVRLCLFMLICSCSEVQS